MKKLKLWLTYDWADNENKDIDYIIQELDKTEIVVKFDRRNLIPGQRLWAQIGGIITDPNECNAWGILLTKNSIYSEACMEELFYALDRALDSREKDFPIFALLHNILPQELPPALKIRLCISLEDKDWVNKTVSAVKKESPGFRPSDLSPFVINEHKGKDGSSYFEIRPRFDRISPFCAAVDYEEYTSGNVTDWRPKPIGTGKTMGGYAKDDFNLDDGTHVWFCKCDNEASSTQSYYLYCKELPKRIWVGHPEKLVLIQNYEIQSR